MTTHSLLETLKTQPETVTFQQVMEVIEQEYEYSPQSFTNGELINQENQNAGSCKIFSFAKLNKLDEQQTLHCFGDFYRADVLQNPNGDDHQNIRNFMKSGWSGIKFEQLALSKIS